MGVLWGGSLTGRNIRADKPGYIPVSIERVLDRYELDAADWAENVSAYGSLFYRLVGRTGQLVQYARKCGQSWFRGKEGSLRLYRQEKKSA